MSSGAEVVESALAPSLEHKRTSKASDPGSPLHQHTTYTIAHLIYTKSESTIPGPGE
jgi:hypothetical protein